MSKKEKQEIEYINEQYRHAVERWTNAQQELVRVQGYAKQLENELRAEKEKYAALLERHIAVMEQAAKLKGN